MALNFSLNLDHLMQRQAGIRRLPGGAMGGAAGAALAKFAGDLLADPDVPNSAAEAILGGINGGVAGAFDGGGGRVMCSPHPPGLMDVDDRVPLRIFKASAEITTAAGADVITGTGGILKKLGGASAWDAAAANRVLAQASDSGVNRKFFKNHALRWIAPYVVVVASEPITDQLKESIVEAIMDSFGLYYQQADGEPKSLINGAHFNTFRDGLELSPEVYAQSFNTDPEALIRIDYDGTDSLSDYTIGAMTHPTLAAASITARVTIGVICAFDNKARYLERCRELGVQPVVS